MLPPRTGPSKTVFTPNLPPTQSTCGMRRLRKYFFAIHDVFCLLPAQCVVRATAPGAEAVAATSREEETHGEKRQGSARAVRGAGSGDGGGQTVSPGAGPVEVGGAGETGTRGKCGFRSQWKSQKHQRYPGVDGWGTRERSGGRVGDWHAGAGRRKPGNRAVSPVLCGHVAAGFVVFADR